MEVHHHSHTARKKWTHYFWEFLMLFLAVFCGFLAEYQLEHKIEKDREKQYMKSILEDLATDTVNINRTVEFAAVVSNGLDSLQKNMYNTDSAFANTLTLYRQNAIYTRFVSITLSDQTATQLRNSGNMRLIQKPEITNKISSYWRAGNQVENIQDNYETRLNNLSIAGYNIFNRKFISPLIWDSITRLNLVAVDTTAILMTYDKNTLINFGNHLDRMVGLLNKFFIPNLEDLKRRAIYLIRLIQKEYHLK